MVFDCVENEKSITVKPVGRLDSTTSDEFSEFVSQHFTEEFDSLVIDFGEVDFISSKGLRVLVSIYKQLNGRTMKLTGANASVMEILRISGLLRIFDVS